MVHMILHCLLGCSYQNWLKTKGCPWQFHLIIISLMNPRFMFSQHPISCSSHCLHRLILCCCLHVSDCQPWAALMGWEHAPLIDCIAGFFPMPSNMQPPTLCIAGSFEIDVWSYLPSDAHPGTSGWNEFLNLMILHPPCLIQSPLNHGQFAHELTMLMTLIVDIQCLLDLLQLIAQ